MIFKPGHLLKYIQADGTEINLHSPPSRAVMNMTGWGYVAPNVHTISGPFQHGSSVLGYRFQERTIALDVVKKGCSRSEWFNERTRLIDALGLQSTNPNYPSLGRLQWEYVEDDTIKQRAADCYLSRGLGYSADPQWFQYGILEQLEFIANNPIIYDPTQTILTINSFDEDLILPMDFPFILGAAIGTENIAYEGSWITYPIIEVDGPTNGFKIENETTDVSIELDYFIDTGITVTFDLTPNYRTVEDSLGNNLINYLKNSNLAEFSIDNVGTNVLKVYVAEYTAATEIRIKYYTRFVGI